MSATEHSQQAAVIAWARAHEQRYPALAYLFAVPNGGWRSKATARRLRAEGVRRGVPDLLLPFPVGDCCGLAIEMKTAGGRLRPEQRVWLAMLRAAGWRAEVCYGAEAAIGLMSEYLGIE